MAIPDNQHPHKQVLLLTFDRSFLVWTSAGLYRTKEDAALASEQQGIHTALTVNVHHLGLFLSLGVGVMVDQLVNPIKPSRKKGVKKG